MQKTLGGDRLGSGKKIKVDLHGYERSTHNMGYIWRSTMSAGTLVPFICEVALPGDTFDIKLDADIKTHPTIGPLFGSYKVQLDVFQAPIRLYNSWLHNNMLNIGRNMSSVKLPLITLTALANATPEDLPDINNSQINPSCILAYLGIRGVGLTTEETVRDFNAVPILAYWEIYKNYYANKQEEIGAVIHTPNVPLVDTIDDIQIDTVVLTQDPTNVAIPVTNGSFFQVNYTGLPPLLSQVIIRINPGAQISLEDLNPGGWVDTGTAWEMYYAGAIGDFTAINWRYTQDTDTYDGPPIVATFVLSNIDDVRQEILAQPGNTPYPVGNPGVPPYSWLVETTNGIPNILSNQEGLAIKTYQSDMFNNWLSTEWIDGPGGITEITSIDTSGGSFSIDTIILARKVYNMLNRIAVSGGSYDDWLDAVYDHDRYQRCESPMYMGGLIKELVFQEVVSNSEAMSEQSGQQPLGTLAGKGVLSKKHKGGTVVIKVDEPSYIIGLISLTPLVDYSQGNKWDTQLKTLDDLHKPGLDGIGFQELITEQMAWWDTEYDAVNNVWVQRSAGKQPAWINYMTNVNRCYGNFATEDNEMFMTLNRRYEYEDMGAVGNIKDLTTYIDPVKFNQIFAQTSIDAQNFWAQIAIDMTVRRKMSAKVMPNL